MRTEELKEKKAEYKKMEEEMMEGTDRLLPPVYEEGKRWQIYI